MSDEFKSGQILSEIKNLHEGLGRVESSLIEFKNGIGQRVEKHGERITSLEASVAVLNKLAWLLFASSMGVVLAAFWKLVLK